MIGCQQPAAHLTLCCTAGHTVEIEADEAFNKALQYS